MKYALIFICLSGCAAERTLFKEDPFVTAGTVAVFVGAVAGLAQ